MSGNDSGLLVIGCGLMRTGSNSLQVALQRLLDGKCYHMYTVVENPKVADFWLKAAVDNPSHDEWRAFLADFKAAIDLPPVAFYKELMEVYPNAKVVLTVRDPDRWFESVNTTITPLMESMSAFPMTIINRLSGMSNFVRMINLLGARVMGITNYRNKDEMIAAYHRHVEEVKSCVPPERLLIFEARDGWKPLCDFLGVSVPDENYPHVNSGDEFRSNMKKMKWLQTLSVIGAALLVVGVGYFAWRMSKTWSVPSIHGEKEL